MNKMQTISLSVLTLACGLAMSDTASAATSAKTFYLDPSMSCQLSIPTTGTGVRPRATGFRNESGPASFVICGLPYYYSGAQPTSYSITANSFDGAAHTFDCTAVSRSFSGANPAFSTKSVTVGASGAGVSTSWTASDGLQLGNFNQSITCALPVGAGITSVQIVVNDEIGS